MSFTSAVFVVFYLVVVGVYWRLGHRAQNLWLLGASYLFYGAWDWRLLGLMLASTVVDFVVARQIGASETRRRRRGFLWISLGCNLLLLGTFKYYDFFAGELAALLTSLGFSVSIPLLGVVLPAGISFYTLQTLSYSIDVYRGDIEPEQHFLDFALFVSFFPQLVAGPIERYRRLGRQIRRPRRLDSEDVREGLYEIVSGYFRKVVLADNLAIFANAAFQSREGLGFVGAWVGIYSFALQLYGDFSGYSLIAKGTARLLGFRLADNFRQPFLALDPSDFWKRWHITFSTWLRDYVYASLRWLTGGRRWLSVNMVLTLVVSGIWHGAGWTFLGAGLIMGLQLVAYRRVHRSRFARLLKGQAWWERLILRVVHFHMICLAWVVFRSPDLAYSVTYLKQLFRFSPADPQVALGLRSLLLFGGLSFVLDLVHETVRNRYPLKRWPWSLEAAVLSLLLLSIYLLNPSGSDAFYYFQF